MEISERIKKIIVSEALTASAFADKTGIQRSNVSQLLSGRQNPRFDVLQKILTAFPRYNADWLVMGRGDIYRQPVQTSIFDIIGDDGEPVAGSVDLDEPGALEGEFDSSQLQNVPHDSVIPEMQQEQSAEKEMVTTNSAEDKSGASASNLSSVLMRAAQRQAEIKQIVVLYSDNTFVAYNKQ